MKGRVTMEEKDIVMYKGFPLIRKGREIIYGNMSDEMVTRMQIMSTHKVNELEVADKVKVLLTLTEPNVDASKMIVKSCDRQSLYEALDIAFVWLTRA